MPLPNIYKPKFNYKLIRLGKKYDGGYLVGLKSVLNSKYLISFGISDDWTFENDFIKINSDINVYSFDDTLDLKWLINRFLKNLKRVFFFEEKPRNLINSFINLFKIKYLKKRLKLKKKIITYDDISQICKDKKNIFFKIDIEGSEHRILNELIEFKDKIIGVVIEFHDIDLHKDKIINFIEKTNLNVTHIHPNNNSILDNFNNPTTIEMTFEKSPEIDNNFELILPHKLDQKCNPKLNDCKIYFE